MCAACRRMDASRWLRWPLSSAATRRRSSSCSRNRRAANASNPSRLRSTASCFARAAFSAIFWCVMSREFRMIAPSGCETSFRATLSSTRQELSLLRKRYSQGCLRCADCRQARSSLRTAPVSSGCTNSKIGWPTNSSGRLPKMPSEAGLW